MKVVINKGFGGFDLSDAQLEQYLILKGIAYDKRTTEFGWSNYYKQGTEEHVGVWDMDRSDPVLVQVVEQTVEQDSDWSDGLKVVEIPDGVDWQIGEYEGNEWVAEVHRTWC